MGKFAQQIGLNEESAVWQNKIVALKQTINEKLYHKEDGFYYDRKSDGHWLEVKTVASFWALFAG